MSHPTTPIPHTAAPIRTYQTGIPRHPWAADRSGATTGYGMTEAEAITNLLEGEAVGAWLQGIGSKPTYGTDVTGILVETDGGIWVINGDGDRARLDAPYVASGSGRIAALGAMAAGASAERAVEIACELDAFTRGPVQVARLVP